AQQAPGLFEQSLHVGGGERLGIGQHRVHPRNQRRERAHPLERGVVDDQLQQLAAAVDPPVRPLVPDALDVDERLVHLHQPPPCASDTVFEIRLHGPSLTRRTTGPSAVPSPEPALAGWPSCPVSTSSDEPDNVTATGVGASGSGMSTVRISCTVTPWRSSCQRCRLRAPVGSTHMTTRPPSCHHTLLMDVPSATALTTGARRRRAMSSRETPSPCAT